MCQRIAETTRTARTEHQCWECYAPINRGEPYLIYAMADGGHAWSIKVHIECDLDAHDADGLNEPGEYCREYRLYDWAQESGYSFDLLGLRPETVSRLRWSRQSAEDRNAARRTAFFADQTSGRWADDGGPA